jgi:hypothetical protein
MNKAVKAIIAVVLICGAFYYMYGQMKKLGYFQGAPPPRQQMAPMEGRQQAAPAPTNAAPEQPAPSTDTATTTQ